MGDPFKKGPFFLVAIYGLYIIVGCTPIPTYPVMGNPYVGPIWWVFMGYNPQESLENTINTYTLPETNIAHENPHLSW